MAFGPDDDFINVNLDDVDDGEVLIPDGQRIVTVISAEKKQKEGSTYPYIEVYVKPDGFDARRIRHMFTFHPTMLGVLKLFVKKCRVKWTAEGFRVSELVGKRIGVNIGNEPHFAEPERQINCFKQPFIEAA
jgi:hypothetical protein